MEKIKLTYILPLGRHGKLENLGDLCTCLKINNVAQFFI